MHNDYDAHIDQIRQLYKEQAQAMTEAMDRYFPETVRYTRPRGGMFLSLIHIFKTEDCKEGVDAFLGKRSPQFR